MKIKITEAQEKNLCKLIKYLRGDLKARFDMEVFSDFGIGDEKNCGSVGCAVGHGPYAGVRKRRKESWGVYSKRVYGLPMCAEWHWCFSAQWSSTDNTPAGAAVRIERLLKRGLPRNWMQQMFGKDPLCYKK